MYHSWNMVLYSSLTLAINILEYRPTAYNTTCCHTSSQIFHIIPTKEYVFTHTATFNVVFFIIKLWIKNYCWGQNQARAVAEWIPESLFTNSRQSSAAAADEWQSMPKKLLTVLSNSSCTAAANSNTQPVTAVIQYRKKMQHNRKWRHRGLQYVRVISSNGSN